MPPYYKRQHYLPVCYLKQFSADQNSRSRDSWIWRFDGKEQKIVSVESQCAADYHYSKENPAEAESMFHELEGRYASVLENIHAGKPLSESAAGVLLLCMFDFHIRNDVHKNKTGEENIEAYRKRVGFLWRDVFLRRTAEPTPENVRKHASTYWGIQIVFAPQNRLFLTSDHPSVWTSLNDHCKSVDIVTMPITPKLMAVAYDRRVACVTSQTVSDEDYLTLIDSQVQNSFRAIYSSNPFPPEQIADWAECIKNKHRHESETDENSWNLSVLGMAPKYHFSFLTLSPCGM